MTAPTLASLPTQTPAASAGPIRGRRGPAGQVKARYDPMNLFHHNHNIPMAIEEPGNEERPPAVDLTSRTLPVTRGPYQLYAEITAGTGPPSC